jgi:hypothetical protein
MRLRPGWIQTSLRICAVWSGSMLFAISFSTCYRVCKWTAWILIRLRGCAGWSGSMLVANPLCSFCYGTAHLCKSPYRHYLDIFLARLTISLSGSSHLSVSASISDVINFISKPSFAILACSYKINCIFQVCVFEFIQNLFQLDWVGSYYLTTHFRICSWNQPVLSNECKVSCSGKQQPDWVSNH